MFGYSDSNQTFLASTYKSEEESESERSSTLLSFHFVDLSTK